MDFCCGVSVVINFTVMELHAIVIGSSHETLEDTLSQFHAFE